MAKELYPGKRNNLDALCDRYGVDNSHRTLHGALLDAEILAEVYVAMTRGQESLIMDLGDGPDTVSGPGAAAVVRARPLRVLRASDEELAAHAAQLAAIDKESKGKCLWLPHEDEN
jgi:DNA polymerase-3 subunit epsilon